MALYTTYGDIQKYIADYYKRTGSGLQFNEAAERMAAAGKLLEDEPPFEPGLNYYTLSDTEFDRAVDKFPMILGPELYRPEMSREVAEDKMIPYRSDVFAIRHPRYTRAYTHRHNYFEMDVVVKGHGFFYFEDEEPRELKEGEIVIVAPDSTHDFLIDDDSIVFCICIRASTFDTSFFSLMARQDLLSFFFRQTLRGDSDKSNYLLFYTGGNPKLVFYCRSLLIESQKADAYSSTCAISYVNLFFSELLRGYSKTIRYYNYEGDADFTLILQYIQHNYQTLTLKSLAEFFHYSEPHLCSLIKENTGSNLTDLVRRLKMRDAVHYLIDTDVKVSEIAELVGYNSADHFSRVFRSEYHMSPRAYREENKAAQAFVPFSTE
ncbi:MAG: helix-turn-helix domain-containing protein [Lachnospiraceae bacterium]|nr:helix-turn-helix domain-containing protein [Lachnospiraceae bacterium]